MGLMEELLRQLEESAERQRRAGQPDAARRVQQRQPEPRRRPEPAQPEVAPVAPVAAVAEVVIERPAAPPHPLLARLRKPGGAREAVILAEILRPRWRR